MSLVPLLDAHSGRHRAPVPPRRTIRDRARRALLALRPPVTVRVPPATVLLAGEPERDDDFPPREVAESARRMPEPVETAPAAGGAPAISGAGAIPPWELPPGSHPYPPLDGQPVLLPLLHGGGHIVLGPGGCIDIRRDTWTAAPDSTQHDLPAVRVPAYLDQMPGGTEP